MPEYEPTAHHAPKSFSWGRVIQESRLRGVPAMIACHCEPITYDSAKPALRLELKDEMRILQRSPAMGRLIDSLKEFFGEGLEVEITFGPAAKSPAALSGAKRIQGHVTALETVMRDDMVQEMIKKFGGQVVVDTVDASLAPSQKPT